MFARISFINDIRIKESEVEELSKYLGEPLNANVLIELEDGTTTHFYSWEHTFDPNVAEIEGKKLVKKSEYVALPTGKEYLVDLADFTQKFPNLKVAVRGISKTIGNPNLAVVNQMLAIQEKLEQALQRFDKQVEFNERCEVHVGNMGILHINQTAYAVDKCTEELQELLNDGWRILAVCPQPDQRRPDYILGRYNPNTGEHDCYEF